MTQDEALQSYNRAVAVLRDAGTEPGPEVRASEDRIRSGDPDAAAPGRPTGRHSPGA